MPPATSGENGSGRRERVRRATREEIRATARALLTERGAAAVTVNAVARQMGMSGPALYRYYDGHDALLEAVTADFYAELTEAMRSARDALAGRPAADRLLASCRAMRSWAVAHPAEFRWVFAGPAPEQDRRSPGSPIDTAAEGFGQVFLDLIAEIWRDAPFPVPPLREHPEALRRQLTGYSERIGGLLPPEAVHVFLECWIRLYGLLVMEALGQLDFACTDLDPVFEGQLRTLCRDLGVEYSPEAGAPSPH
ncbi:TetR-like C-terminal domain-containing protein [Nocardiopsis potens]|uniref:TetR-like C-terminal domain-containing protein n=1 Tax=Nocardiopsis potens TaxID=1246458 RepID=UPI000349BA79|nr:TetR/AcrR family transcriptional regulator [Nocardiopsis potens]